MRADVLLIKQSEIRTLGSKQLFDRKNLAGSSNISQSMKAAIQGR
jgi:hypothetical protein